MHEPSVGPMSRVGGTFHSAEIAARLASSHSRRPTLPPGCPAQQTDCACLFHSSGAADVAGERAWPIPAGNAGGHSSIGQSP